MTDAQYADGLLTIDLIREIPEALKPRRIEINATPPQRRLDRKPTAAAV